MQDTIVKAFRFFDSYEKGTNAKAWLFRILKNSFINNYRRNLKKPQEVDYEEVAAFYENVRVERTETTDLEHLIFRDKMDDRFSKALSNFRRISEQSFYYVMWMDLPMKKYPICSTYLLNCSISTAQG